MKKKIPAEIKKAIKTSAKHYAIAREYNSLIRQWIEENHGDESIDYWLDQLIDGTEISNNPEGVIATFENFLNGIYEYQSE